MIHPSRTLTGVIVLVLAVLTALPCYSSPKKVRHRKPLCLPRQDLGQRTLVFRDNDWAIGHLYLFRLYRHRTILFLGEAIHDLGPAKGKVTIPARKCAGFQLTPEGLTRMNELKVLKPNDIQMFYVHCIPFTTQDLKSILHLTGLEKLHLTLTQIDKMAPAQIAKLPNLWSIVINSSQLTDENLDEFNKLKHLGVLNLDYNHISDKGIAALSKNRTIYSLSINNCDITAKSADSLAKMNQLQMIKVVNSKFNDAALRKLVGLKKLFWIEVGKNQISQQCLQEVRKALPNCRVLEVPVDPYRAP